MEDENNHQDDNDRQEELARQQENDDASLFGDPNDEEDDDEVDDDEEEEDDENALALLFGNDDEEYGNATALAVQQAEKRLQECQKAHQRRVQRTALQLDVARGWSMLPGNQRKSAAAIPVILYCLQQASQNKPIKSKKHQQLPDCMQWGKFEGEFPSTVCGSKQVMMARLEHVSADEFDALYGPQQHESDANNNNNNNNARNNSHSTPAGCFPVSRRLQGDPEVMLALCRRSPQTLSKASPDLRKDKKFVLSVLELHPAAMEHVSAELRDNKAFARRLVNA